MVIFVNLGTSWLHSAPSFLTNHSSPPYTLASKLSVRIQDEDREALRREKLNTKKRGNALAIADKRIARLAEEERNAMSA